MLRVKIHNEALTVMNIYAPNSYYLHSAETTGDTRKKTSTYHNRNL